ncbi:MAG: 3-dehydroquinate synthase, partial [Phycisphaerales bacterium]|nr:3-dehydroquinate synthase [Phycisphaerales bacterium]
MPEIAVSTPSRRYSVFVEPDQLPRLPARLRGTGLSPRAAHLIVDANLPAAAVDVAAKALRDAGIAVTRSDVSASEAGKSLQTAHHLLAQATAAKLERRDVVVAIGGGIVGDMAGFVAATYRRGIPWVNVPTTLLSMVDASIGGKTGVNIRAGGELFKNMVGAFWQPSLVLADVSLLASLPERDFRSGLAECIKHALLSAAADDPALLHDTRALLGRVLARESSALEQLVARNIAVKARIVGHDEREEAPSAAGGRALLNLGHTFGHAIETIIGASPTPDKALAPLTHGEAVTLGIICAAKYSELDRLMPTGFADELRTTLRHAGLPTQAFNLPSPNEIYTRMLHDKKASGGALRLVVPCGPGLCRVVDDPPRERVLQAIEAIVPA